MDGAKDARQSRVEVAKEVLVRRLAVCSIALGGCCEPADVVPCLMRNPGRLGDQKREDEKDPRESARHPPKSYPIKSASNYLARHSSRPAMKMSFGSFLPMNTRTDCFASFFAHGLPMSPPIIMCTPWKTTRRGSPFIHSTPL